MYGTKNVTTDEMLYGPCSLCGSDKHITLRHSESMAQAAAVILEDPRIQMYAFFNCIENMFTQTLIAEFKEREARNGGVNSGDRSR